MKIIYKNKKIKIPVKKVSALGKITGLMFKSGKTENLLFVFGEKTKMKIHSFFVFFNFLVLWINDEGKVLEWRVIKPFTLGVSAKKVFSKLIEIPINKKNRKIVKFFVGKGKV